MSLMKRDDFVNGIHHGLTQRIALEARPIFSRLKRDPNQWEIWLDYDWIKNDKIYNWPSKNKAVDICDGSSGITFFVYPNLQQNPDDSFCHPHPFKLHREVPEEFRMKVLAGEDFDRYGHGMPIGTEDEVLRLEQKYVGVEW